MESPLDKPYSNFQLFQRYLSYRWKAKTQYGVHSPFVYDLITKVIYSKGAYYAFEELNAVRFDLCRDHHQIEVVDHGAGSRISGNTTRSVSEITASAVGERKFLELYFKLADYFKSGSILELGTSLGLSSAYFARARPKARVISLEGSETLVAKAKELHQKLKINNIELVNGAFKDTLTTTLTRVRNSLDLVFIDGHHAYQPTLNYFETIVPKLHNDSLLIIDDIHWSPGMEKAWRSIQEDERVSVSIDLFRSGLVFFRKEQEKENFVIRF